MEYERHAAECRQMAAQMNSPQLRKQLEDMADVWDRLARERRQGIVETNPEQTWYRSRVVGPPLLPGDLRRAYTLLFFGRQLITKNLALDR